MDSVSRKLTASERVAEVILLPSLLTPKEATIPVLREAAVRLQADLLLVFRPTSDIYCRSKIFAQDRVKAYCTCEAVLLDVRTGLIPFTTVITRDRSDQKEKEDLDLNETMRRAESAAVLDSLNAGGGVRQENCGSVGRHSAARGPGDGPAWGVARPSPGRRAPQTGWT